MALDNPSPGTPETPSDPSALSDGAIGLHSPESAIRDAWSHARLWLVAAAGLALDLWTKHLAFTRLDPDPANTVGYPAIPHLMSFRRSLNPGALFGLGKGLTPVFIAASLLALGFVLFLFMNSSRKRRSLHVALALVLAGALGNLFDRAFMIADVVKYTHPSGRRITEVGVISNPGQVPIRLGSWPECKAIRTIPQYCEPEVRRQGVVRDFIKMEPQFTVGSLHIELWPWVFNIADVLLVVGVGLLLLNFWWERRAEKAAQASAGSGGPV
jgi:lipoprotein signal peptidase